ncbi:helicase associated domain-containing protein [Leifsonia sp. Leaf264]|uniref:helicase associated domain-containing protein n=1 Tax=Leifsonia sp. Leaf264 TaxID=1736314 RepID=UPI0007003EBD|nr:helicase associated domain-containing protein [Leifsonia sp. Leaf264]KQO98760.1 hypothetical protein ASF30_11910 [Leifsonia sp. Leaf264]
MTSPLPSLFAVRVDELNRFVNDHGRLPNSQVGDTAEATLAKWCQAQRNRTEGRLGTMTDAEADALEAIPGWYWQAPDGSTVWKDRLAELQAFVLTHGDIPRRRGDTAAEKSLANWVRVQRAKKTNPETVGTLTVEQSDALEVIPGWWWSGQPTSTFKSAADDLLAWVKSTGTFPKEYTTDKEERRLASFVTRYRDSFRAGTLGRPQAEQLEAIPGWDWQIAPAEQWWDTLISVAAWVTENGRIPRGKCDDETERKFGRWCEHARRAAKPGSASTLKMTDTRRRALEAFIPGWYWSK